MKIMIKAGGHHSTFDTAEHGAYQIGKEFGYWLFMRLVDQKLKFEEVLKCWQLYNMLDMGKKKFVFEEDEFKFETLREKG